MAKKNDEEKTNGIDIYKDNEIRENLDKFLSVLKKYNGRASNISLRSDLGWDDNKYWEIHRIAVDRGIVIKGRGRGGIVIYDSEDSEDSERINDENSIREASYYGAIKSAMETVWIPQQGYESYMLEITAHQGRKDTGGKWTRPDLTLVGTKIFPYIPGRHFEIVTFEVKVDSRMDITCLYESLSHNVFSTKSYLIIVGSEQVYDISTFSSILQDGTRIIDAAIRHGIGVIYVQKSNDNDKIIDEQTIIEIIPPATNIPDLEAANRLIATSFSDDARQSILKLMK